jgi:serine/threonine protein kinase
MPSPPDTQQVFDQLIESQILTAQQIDQLQAELDSASPTFLDACLTQSRLNGWLTRWQTEQISSGRIGSLRFGEFLLVQFVHRGRMARIFRAVSVVDHRHVALKILTSQGQADPKAIAGLERELAVSRKINSPTIARCEGIEIYEGRHCLIREWVDGLTLHEWTREHGRYDRKKLIPLLITLSRTLAEFHAAGYRHGAVSGSHIIIRHDGLPVWIDPGHSSGLNSKPGSVDTSFSYADFERSTAANSGEMATDAYFLGSVFYELISGGSPHPELENEQKLKGTTLRTYGSEIPLESISEPPARDLARLVAAMMNVHRERRLADPLQIFNQLTRIQSGKAPEENEMGSSYDSIDTAEMHRWLAGGDVTESIKAQPISPSREMPAAPDANMTHVICVECQEEIQLEFRKTFEKLGWRARLVRSADSAQEMARERAPDMIVFDCDGLGPDSLEAFFELDRISSLGHTPPRGILLLGPKQRKFMETLPESVRQRFEILQKPLKMRAVKTSLLACAIRN